MAAVHKFVFCIVATAALVSIPLEVNALNKANIPQEVIDGWQRLASKSQTFTILLSQLDKEGNNMFNPGVLSRLNNQYMKYERMQPNSTEGDWPEQITEVILYDGSDYFTLERPDGAYRLTSVGNDRGVYQLLKVNAAPSTSVLTIDLLQAINSETATFTKFERSNEGTFVYLRVASQPEQQFEIVARLDEKYDFRVESATQTFADSPRQRRRVEYHYDEHPSLASKWILYPEKIDDTSNKWVLDAKDAPYIMCVQQHLLKNVQLEAEQFTIQHYGLPPFKKRNPSIWPTVAMIASGLGLIFSAAYWWKNGSAVR